MDKQKPQEAHDLQDSHESSVKPFDIVTIILLVLVSVFSDVADAITDLIALVPYVGQVVYVLNSFILSPIIWFILQFTFFLKTGGTKSVAKRVVSWVIVFFGGIGNIQNLPGSETITTVIGIIIANSSIASKAAAVATAKPSTGAGAAKGAASTAGTAGTATKEAGATKESSSAAQKKSQGAPAAEGQGAEGAATKEGAPAKPGQPTEGGGAPREEGISEKAFGAESLSEVKELEGVKQSMSEPLGPDKGRGGGSDQEGRVVPFRPRKNDNIDLHGNDVHIPKEEAA